MRFDPAIATRNEGVVIKRTKMGLDVSTEVNASECRILIEDLSLMTKRGGSDEGAVGQVSNPFHFSIGSDEGIVYVFARKIAGKNGPIRKPVCCPL